MISRIINFKSKSFKILLKNIIFIKSKQKREKIKKIIKRLIKGLI